MKAATWVKMIAGYELHYEYHQSAKRTITNGTQRNSDVRWRTSVGVLCHANRGGAFPSMFFQMTLQNLTHIVQRYNPELQRRSLENRYQKQEDFDKFVTKLKEYSKSDKPSK